jgi:hypothetical protein
LGEVVKLGLDCNLANIIVAMEGFVFITAINKLVEDILDIIMRIEHFDFDIIDYEVFNYNWVSLTHKDTYQNHSDSFYLQTEVLKALFHQEQETFHVEIFSYHLT